MRPLLHMKLLLVTVVTILFYCPNYSAATFTATSTTGGNWNNGASWGNANPGTVGVDFPGAGDVARIPSGKSITIPAGYAAAAASLSMNNNAGSTASTLTLASSTASLTLTGNLTMSSSTPGCKTSPTTPNLSVSVIHQIVLNGGTLSVGGSLTMNAGPDPGCASNDEQTITLGGGTLSVTGNITMNQSGGYYSTIDMTTANSVLNVGANLTIGRISNGSGASGRINYTGAAGQTILSAITYYDLGFSGGGLKTLNGTTTVANTLYMVSGNINLNTYTLSLTNTGTYNALTYTSGWGYNGSVKRFIDPAGVTLGTDKGLFPVGSSTHKRHMWVATGASASGSITVSHTGVYPATYNVASHVDATWGTGTTLQGVSQSYWTVATGDGFADNADIRYGGLGFGTNTLTDLNASLSGSVVGTHAAATGTGTEPYANRTGISAANLNNNFRIGTKDIAQSPLPVKLISFDAVPSDNAVDINWTTITEINSRDFTVQRSIDGLEYKNIETIPGAGNSNTVLNYYLRDNSPARGLSYYRLMQTDYNGEISYSQAIAVNYTKTEINVFPNPSYGQINISFDEGFTQGAKITIIDVLGRNCYEQIITSKHHIIEFNKQNFGPGLYYISLTTADKILHQQPLQVY